MASGKHGGEVLADLIAREQAKVDAESIEREAMIDELIRVHNARVDAVMSAEKLMEEASRIQPYFIPVSDTQTFTLVDPTRQLIRDLHRVQYSAFCQQWIAIAMAAIIGRE